MQQRKTDDWLRIIEGNGGPRVEPDNWPCICGRRWRICVNRGNRVYRGNPVDIDPMSQWCSERLPAGRDGTTTHDADIGIRRFVPKSDPYGYVIIIEKKTFSATTSPAQDWTLEAMALPGRLFGGVVLTLSGNTPGPVDHYPAIHPDVLKPEQPVVSDIMSLEWRHPFGKVRYDETIDEAVLIDLFSGGFSDMLHTGLVLRETSHHLGGVPDAVTLSDFPSA